MPELPEIETIKRGLEEKITGLIFSGVAVNNDKVLKNKKDFFVSNIGKTKVDRVSRRGKMIVLFLDNGMYLLIRLGMTGRLVYFEKEDIFWTGDSFKENGSFANKHCHVVFTFNNGSSMLFCDARRFGNLEVVDEEGFKNKMKSFGFEPLDNNFDIHSFSALLSKKRGNIKAFLLNQKYIAGIGNIYADEILFESAISPLRSVESLSKSEIKSLYVAIKKILKKAVKNRGTSFSDYVDSSGNKGNFVKYLKVYNQSGKICSRCGKGKIEKIRVASRGTSFCRLCQK